MRTVNRGTKGEVGYKLTAKALPRPTHTVGVTKSIGVRVAEVKVQACSMDPLVGEVGA